MRINKSIWITFGIALVIVVCAALAGRLWIQALGAENTPKPVLAAQEWEKEHADEVRAARKLIAEHEKYAAVFTAFDCQFNWDTFTVMSCGATQSASSPKGQ